LFIPQYQTGVDYYSFLNPVTLKCEECTGKYLPDGTCKSYKIGHYLNNNEHKLIGILNRTEQMRYHIAFAIAHIQEFRFRGQGEYKNDGKVR
jgi:hypothetical protein